MKKQNIKAGLVGRCFTRFRPTAVPRRFWGSVVACAMTLSLGVPAFGAPLTVQLGDSVAIDGKLFAQKFYTSDDDPTYKGKTAFLPIIVSDRKLAFKFSAIDKGFLHGAPPSEPVDRIELEFKDPSLLTKYEKNEGKPARIQGSLIIDQNNRLLPVKLEVSHLQILEHAGETKVTTPKLGTQLRKNICNAFRVPMTKEVNGQKIVFVIHTLNVMGDWAFINCSLQLANGKEVDWSKTKFKSDAEVDGIENNAVGLLKKDSKGKWSVVEHSFNHTDVAWIGWNKKYGISQKLFE